MNTKIFWFFALLFLGFWHLSFVFAQSLQLRASMTETVLNQPISITVELDGVTSAGNINLVWIEQFIVRWQSQSTNMQVINGVSRAQVQLAIQLEPTTTWTFVLWPAILWNWTGGIKSNTVTISVKDIPIPEKQDNQPVWSENTTSSFYRLWYLFSWLLIAWWIVVRKRKWIITKSQESTIEHPFRDMLSIPSASDTDFWDAMDLWWRLQLSHALHKDVDHATLQELRPEIIALPMLQQELFITALTLIQKTKYAGVVWEPSILIDLAHRLEKIVEKTNRE